MPGKDKIYVLVAVRTKFRFDGESRNFPNVCTYLKFAVVCWDILGYDTVWIA